jgi:WD40 repeat protein/tRNA A-37 threonylcarbamoyl transferase component Bud32
MNQTEDWRPNGLAAGPYPDSNPAPSEADARLVQALQEYRAAVHAGQKPDRQAFLARHAEIAAELAECLDGLEFIQGTAPQMQAAEDQARVIPLLPGEISAGTVLGDYEILHEIGRGGMGVVYKARQRSLHRVVALKMVLAGQYAASLEVKRLRTEAEAAAHLDHPHIVPIYEVGEHDGRHYFSMKLIEGSNLAQHTACFRSDPRAAANLLATVARAVHYAHQRGILHRDLKPANILLDAQGRPHVTDFGLAKRIAAGDSLGQSQTGAVAGTPSYMAPEQAAGKRGLSTAVDVYSLGAILYELLTGQPPFQGESGLAILRRVMEEEPKRPRLFDPHIDKDLETICLKCLEKEPAQRYGSAEALAEDLERWLAGEPIQARPANSWERTIKWARRQPAVASLLLVSGLALVALIISLAVSYVVVSHEQQQTADALVARTRALAEREQALQREQETSYFQTIALAAPEVLANNVQRADRLLDSCLPEYRNWEWHYLKRLCHAELLTLHPRTEPACVTFSPDGQRVAAAGGVLGRPGEINLWDSATGQVLLTITGHADVITDLAFSPDGQCLATSSGDQTVKVWDTQSGREIRTLRGHEGSVWSVAYSPDGRRIASASADRTVKVWSAITGKELLTLRGHEDSVWHIAFSGDGQQLASASADQAVKIWDTGTGREVHTLRGHKGIVRGVAFSHDGQRLASAGYDNTVKVWDATSGQELLTFRGHTKCATGVAFNPDGRRLASSSVDQTIKVWDAATGEDLQTLCGHTDSVWAVAFSPDGQRIASAGANGTVKLWKATDLLVNPIQLGPVEPIHQAVLSADGGRFALAGESGIGVWDSSSGRRLSTHDRIGIQVNRLAMSPDGKRIAAMKSFGMLAIWNADNGQELHALPGFRGGVADLVFSGDGEQLATVGGGMGVLLWDVATGQLRKALLEHEVRVGTVQFSGDSKRLGAILGDSQERQEVMIWDTESGREVFARANAGGRAILSPDGAFIALVEAGTAASECAIWDVQSGLKAFVLGGHTAPIRALAYSPDGRRLASAGQDQTIKLWEASTGREILTLSGVGGPVDALVFSKDGTRLFSIDSDGTVRTWDATPLRTVRAAPEPDAPARMRR